MFGFAQVPALLHVRPLAQPPQLMVPPQPSDWVPHDTPAEHVAGTQAGGGGGGVTQALEEVGVEVQICPGAHAPQVIVAPQLSEKVPQVTPSSLHVRRMHVPSVGANGEPLPVGPS